LTQIKDTDEKNKLHTESAKKIQNAKIAKKKGIISSQITRINTDKTKNETTNYTNFHKLNKNNNMKYFTL